MREKETMRGFYEITARDAVSGKVLNRWRLENQLTAINRTIRNQMLLNTYTGGTDALKIRYFAFGTDDTPATEAQTALGSEQFRKALTQIYENNGSVVSVVSLQSSEANFRIKEIGVFCGPAALSTADSGTMLSRVVCDIDKNANIVLNIVRTDSVTLG